MNDVIIKFALANGFKMPNADQTVAELVAKYKTKYEMDDDDIQVMLREVVMDEIEEFLVAKLGARQQEARRKE